MRRFLRARKRRLIKRFFFWKYTAPNEGGKKKTFSKRRLASHRAEIKEANSCKNTAGFWLSSPQISPFNFNKTDRGLESCYLSKEKEREAQKKPGGGCNPKLAQLWEDTGIPLCHPSSVAIKEKKDPLRKTLPGAGGGGVGTGQADSSLARHERQR